jgi:hypothetical protein
VQADLDTRRAVGGDADGRGAGDAPGSARPAAAPDGDLQLLRGDKVAIGEGLRQIVGGYGRARNILALDFGATLDL